MHPELVVNCLPVGINVCALGHLPTTLCCNVTADWDKLNFSTICDFYQHGFSEGPVSHIFAM